MHPSIKIRIENALFLNFCFAALWYLKRMIRTIFSRALMASLSIIDLRSEVGVANRKVTRRGSSLWKAFSQPQPNSRNEQSALLKNPRDWL